MRSPLRYAVILAFLMTAFAFAGDEKFATVNFTVVREFNGKPVRAASVILHPLDGKGNQKSSGQQLKTDADGKAQHPALPYGKMRVQVIAPGLQTFGEDLDINQDTMDIVIKLKKPQEQHSIYK